MITVRYTGIMERNTYEAMPTTRLDDFLTERGGWDGQIVNFNGDILRHDEFYKTFGDLGIPDGSTCVIWSQAPKANA